MCLLVLLASPSFFRLGSYIILPTKARGDYGSLEQATRNLSFAGLRTWYQTARENKGRNFESPYRTILCEHVKAYANISQSEDGFGFWPISAARIQNLQLARLEKYKNLCSEKTAGHSDMPSV